MPKPATRKRSKKQSDQKFPNRNGNLPAGISAVITTGEKAAAQESLTTVPRDIPPISSDTTNELRTRIKNAVKAIGDLGGKIETTDHAQMSEEELQLELEVLNNQCKRLKTSKSRKLKGSRIQKVFESDNKFFHTPICCNFHLAPKIVVKQKQNKLN